MENSLEQYKSTFPTEGGLKVQEAEVIVMSLERTEVLFQTFVSTEVKVTYTETPPTSQGTPCLSFHRSYNSSAFSHTLTMMRQMSRRICVTVTYFCVTLAV